MSFKLRSADKKQSVLLAEVIDSCRYLRGCHVHPCCAVSKTSLILNTNSGRLLSDVRSCPKGKWVCVRTCCLVLICLALNTSDMPRVCWCLTSADHLRILTPFSPIWLSFQETRAERDHKGEAFITGPPSPPPGTRLLVHARQRRPPSTWSMF